MPTYSKLEHLVVWRVASKLTPNVVSILLAICLPRLAPHTSFVEVHSYFMQIFICWQLKQCCFASLGGAKGQDLLNTLEDCCFFKKSNFFLNNSFTLIKLIGLSLALKMIIFRCETSRLLESHLNQYKNSHFTHNYAVLILNKVKLHIIRSNYFL